MNNSGKINDSCVRVLELLKLLCIQDIDFKDITTNFQQQFKDIEAPETFLKYISTLEYSGLNIRKINKKYRLCAYPAHLDLNENEISLFTMIYDIFEHSCIESQREDFDDFITNIAKSLSVPFRESLLKEIDKKRCKNRQNLTKNAQNFQKYVDLGQKIKITYSSKSFVVEPKSVEIENGYIYFTVYNPQKAGNMKLLTNKIQNIEILPLKSMSLNITETIVFEVYDMLAVNYRLRKWERIQDFTDDYKVIVNCGEDREILLRRLLKYGESCKIRSPKSFQDEYINTINKISSKLQERVK